MIPVKYPQKFSGDVFCRTPDTDAFMRIFGNRAKRVLSASRFAPDTNGRNSAGTSESAMSESIGTIDPAVSVILA
jgi:hypothetical protein